MASTMTYRRTALVLPLPTLAHILDPTPYSHPIRIALWETTDALTIIFTSPLFRPDGPIGSNRLAAWETLQRFLGCVYGFASQEAMRVGRVAMGVDVLVEGWGGGEAQGWVEGEWDRVVGVGELIFQGKAFEVEGFSCSEKRDLRKPQISETTFIRQTARRSARDSSPSFPSLVPTLILPPCRRQYRFHLRQSSINTRHDDPSAPPTRTTDHPISTSSFDTPNIARRRQIPRRRPRRHIRPHSRRTQDPSFHGRLDHRPETDRRYLWYVPDHKMPIFSADSSLQPTTSSSRKHTPNTSSPFPCA